MNRRGIILLIDDDEIFLSNFSQKLGNLGYQVTPSPSIPDALKQLKKRSFDILISDVRMPYNGTADGGLELAKKCKKLYPATKIIFISEYVTVDLVNKFIGHKNARFVNKSENLLDELGSIIQEIIRRHFVFVIMPFEPQFNDIYELGIKAAVSELGFRCSRVDEMEFNSAILDKIVESIQRATIIIADLSIQSPNVYYELGYAHCLKKEVILIAKEINKVPFDLSGFNVLVYQDSISKLKKDLANRIVAIMNP